MFIFSGRSNCPKGTQCNKLAKKTQIDQKIIDSAEQQIKDNGHIVDSHTEEDREKSKKSIFSRAFKGKSDQASSAPLILTAANRQKKVQQGYQHRRYLGRRRTKRKERYTWLIVTKTLYNLDKTGKKRIPLETGYFWFKCRKTGRWRKAYQMRLAIIVCQDRIISMFPYGYGRTRFSDDGLKETCVKLLYTTANFIKARTSVQPPAAVQQDDAKDDDSEEDNVEQDDAEDDIKQDNAEDYDAEEDDVEQDNTEQDDADVTSQGSRGGRVCQGSGEGRVRQRSRGGRVCQGSGGGTGGNGSGGGRGDNGSGGGRGGHGSGG